MSARVLGAVALAAVLGSPGTARAFKPYTHNFSASQVLQSIDFASSQIRVQGRWYPLDPRVSAALRDYPSYYLAGSVGPDGLPDLVYGQSVIHPVHTGAWLQYLLTEAWLAQAPGSGYTAQEKGQILAFAYGYLVHAAGDVWSHTIVNELAGGVFPGLEDITGAGRTMAERVEAVGWAAKHIISEGVVTDATPGADGDREHRKVAPDGYGRTGGDVSNDATPGYPYDAPHPFIYQALVREEAPTPILAVPGRYGEARGALLGWFLTKRHDLRAFISTPYPSPLADAVDAFDDTVTAAAAARSHCDEWWEIAFGPCEVYLIWVGINVIVDSVQTLLAWIADAVITAARLVIDAYLYAWIQDIDRGLPHWSELGLATTRGLFDAQTRRDVQNEECWWHDPGASTGQPEGGTACADPAATLGGCAARASCEDGIGSVDAALKRADPFVNAYALSMVGLPDLVGGVREAATELGDFLTNVLHALGAPGIALWGNVVALQEWVKDLILDALSAAIGLDVEDFAQMLETPSRYMCMGATALQVPGLGAITVPLFVHGEHQRLDDHLGLPPGHHVTDGGLGDCGRLQDGVTYDLARFAPFADTVTLASLLLLDGPTLDGAVGDVLGREVHTYDVADASRPWATNVMYTQNLAADAQGTFQPWLEMIDGDHAWRFDGSPVFTTSRGLAKTGGHGTFPLWESCALRPAFRALFTDWENPWSGRGPLPGTPLENFPDLGDQPASDPSNDPSPPASRLDCAGASFTDGTSLWVGPGHAFTLTAADVPPGRAFPVEQVTLQRRVHADGAAAPPFAAAAQGEVFSLAGADGLYLIEFRSADPCHTLEGGPLAVGLPEPTQTRPVYLDQTGPMTSCGTPPFGMTWATDAFATVAYTLSDGAGAGVASAVSVLHGVVGEPGPVLVANGATLDMLQLLPGTHTVAVIAVDRVGNASLEACTFELHATFDSLVNNVERLHAEGLLKRGAYHSLLVKALAARRAAEKGAARVAANLLEAFIHEARAQRGKGIVKVRADQLVAYARDLLETTRGEECAWRDRRHRFWEHDDCKGMKTRAQRFAEAEAEGEPWLEEVSQP